MSTELVLLPRDITYADADPMALAFEFFGDKRRVLAPKVVKFSTLQLKYNSAYWLRIERLEDTKQIGSVNGIWRRPSHIDVSARNVAKLTVLTEKLPAIPRSGALVVRLNGVEHRTTVHSNPHITLALSSAGRNKDGRMKDHLVEGPLAHAFSGSFVVVQATGGSERDRRIAERVARQIRDTWRESYYVPCPYKIDRDVDTADIENRHLILAGSVYNNTALEVIRAQLPIRVHADSITIGSKRIRGSDLIAAVAYYNPRNHRKYAVVVDGNGADCVLPKLDLARDGLVDAIVWQADSVALPAMIGSWNWDSDWGNLHEALLDRSASGR
jgi:hypothetical protein